MKTWTVVIIEDDEGKVSTNRTNDGFNIFELMALTEIQARDLMDMLHGKVKVDEIKRTVVVREPELPL